MTRTSISTGSKYEELMGYSRAIIADGVAYVSGCSGLPADIDVAGPGDAASQFAHAVAKVSRILEQAGSALENVSRTRIYLTHADDWEPLIEAHGHAFSIIRPACTMVQVVRLIDPRMRVEVEVTATVEQTPGGQEQKCQSNNVEG